MPGEPHLYVSDLDGTLLGRDARLSERSRSLLNAAVAEGALFTIASARGIHSIRSALQGLELRLPVIEFNGAFITDAQSGRHEVVHALEARIAAEVFARMASLVAAPLVSAYDGERDSLYHRAPANPGVAAYLEERQQAGDPRLRRVNDLEARLDEQVVCLTLIAKAEQLDPLEQEFEQCYAGAVQCHVMEDLYRPGWHWLTVHAGTATKARALSEVLARSGVPARRLVVFGDQTNDLSMFELAGHAVAVENAVPELKAAAHEVIGRHDEDAVAEFIARHARLSGD